MHNLKWVLLIIFADQATKILASTYLNYLEPVGLTSFFNLTLVHNTGAAFSFLSDAGGWQRWMFAAIAIAVSVFIIGWLRKLKPEEKLLSWALVLVLAGAVGNLIDRIGLGYVVDFLDFHWAGYHFPAFNIADIAISVGAVLMAIDALFSGRETSGEQRES